MKSIRSKVTGGRLGQRNIMRENGQRARNAEIRIKIIDPWVTSSFERSFTHETHRRTSAAIRVTTGGDLGEYSIGTAILGPARPLGLF